jgi:hypothetical protein
MDPLFIEAMVRAHLQTRAEHHLTRPRRRRSPRSIVSRVFYEHRTMPR